MWVWTGYFDTRLSRSEGRRVPKEASIPNPTLEAVAWAARAAGITRMRRKPETSHPSRPYSQEGRLEISAKDALGSTKAESKEGVLQSIGLRLRSQMKEAKEAEAKKEREERAQRAAETREEKRRRGRQNNKRSKY